MASHSVAPRCVHQLARKRGPRFGFNEGCVHIDLIGEVAPIRVHGLDQLKLPGLVPFLDLLFVHVGKTIYKVESRQPKRGPRFRGGDGVIWEAGREPGIDFNLNSYRSSRLLKKSRVWGVLRFFDFWRAVVEERRRSCLLYRRLMLWVLPGVWGCG